MRANLPAKLFIGLHRLLEVAAVLVIKLSAHDGPVSASLSAKQLHTRWSWSRMAAGKLAFRLELRG
jgi:hypothetical protein